MIVLIAVLAMAPCDLAGFWNSEPDLDEGYGSCYFFWENGEYAYLRSLGEGILYTGEWSITGDRLVLKRWEAMRLDGTPVDMGIREISLVLTEPRGKTARILLDGDAFYRLGTDPDTEIISLTPAYGMSESEQEVFSAYD